MSRRNRPSNHLYYGDNLGVMRREIADESVDLIYLDPPFNSNANYNILFRSPAGDCADAQIEAFQDTWHWNDQAEAAFDAVSRSGNTAAFDLLNAMRRFLGENDMMAYLAMMAVRLLELRRVLKPTGSLYLHCDPTAGHYLKLLLDGVFGPRNFRREIVWRSGWVSGFKTRTDNWVRNHDTLFYYLKDHTAEATFNKQYVPHAESYKRRGGGENPQGKAIDDVWDDPALYSPNIKSFSTEKLGYPTQKPVALLERIIVASSNPGDVVLDPFCGCGTAVHAAQKLDRQWIGIDVTHLAVALIEKRMRDAFPDSVFTVEGTPRDLASAEDLAARDKYQFQWWAVSMVDALPYGGKKKGPDGGIDGVIYFDDLDPARGIMAKQRAIVSVKGGTKPSVTMVETLAATIERERAPIGVLVMNAKPTKEMERRAAAVGIYRDGIDDSFPRLQILTLADLFKGKRPRIPNVDRSVLRSAKVETGRQGSLL